MRSWFRTRATAVCSTERGLPARQRRRAGAGDHHGHHRGGHDRRGLGVAEHVLGQPQSRHRAGHAQLGAGQDALQAVAENVWERGGVVSSVCHGGAIFPGIKDAQTGKSIIDIARERGELPRPARDPREAS